MVEASRQRFDYVRVADAMAQIFRKDVAAGVNGSCAPPLPQVLEKTKKSRFSSWV